MPASGAGHATNMRLHTLHPISRSTAGFTIVELLLVLAVAATLTTMAIPITRDTVDEIRTATAARYVASRLRDARMTAVKTSVNIGLRFEADGSDYRFTLHADGNGNGVRSADISLGIDPPLGSSERLGDKFPEVSFGLMDGSPDIDNDAARGADGVRIGTPRIASASPDGTSTPGTLYIRGRRSQYAVRILGTTGRVRVLQYDMASASWVPR